MADSVGPHTTGSRGSVGTLNRSHRDRVEPERPLRFETEAADEHAGTGGTGSGDVTTSGVEASDDLEVRRFL